MHFNGFFPLFSCFFPNKSKESESMGYRVKQYGKKSERRDYTKMLYDVELPNLIEIQTNLFRQFIENGILELLHDISPIEGHNGELRLYFETINLTEPKYRVHEAKVRDVNYSGQLYATVRLENAKGELRETKDILMAELPIMTPAGTFIINGAERVVISQIVRSSGVYYTAELDKKVNRMKYSGQVIPTRGAWIEFEQGSKEIFFAKLDRSKKVPLTTFIRALGLNSKKDIEQIFGKNTKLDETFKKDETKNQDEAIVDLYAKLRQGERVPADAAREFIKIRLFDRRRYDLAAVGRFKFNQKLDVLSRVLGTYLVNDVISPTTGEVIVAKDTEITREVIQILNANRDAFRVQAIDKVNNLENERTDEILATYLPDGGEYLYTKDNIYNTKTGEILIAKDTIVDYQLLSTLQSNRSSLDEKVVSYFLTEDVYLKENTRDGVYTEVLDVYALDENSSKLPSIRVIG